MVLASPSVSNITECSLDEYLSQMRRLWRQGEHVAMIGPTGRGKTTIARQLLAIRDYVCVLGIKKFDETLDTFKRKTGGSPAYTVVKDWPPPYQRHRVIYWQKPESLIAVREQALKVYDVMDEIFNAGGWCVFFDDASYLAATLRLGDPMTVFLNQGRSSGISAVVASTRPRQVPLAAWTQVRHLISFKGGDVEELKRTAQIASIGWREFVEANGQLRVYTDRRGRASYSDFLAVYDGRMQLVRVR